MYSIKVSYINTCTCDSGDNIQKGGKNNKHNKYDNSKHYDNDLYAAGIKYKTDKLTHHGYHRFYDFLLKPYKNKNIKMLEVGIDDKKSL